MVEAVPGSVIRSLFDTDHSRWRMASRDGRAAPLIMEQVGTVGTSEVLVPIKIKEPGRGGGDYHTL